MEINFNPIPASGFSFGIFTYCFCTFFLTIFINNELGRRIWYIHDVINIATYFLFTVGFIAYGKMKSEPPVKRMEVL